MEAKDIIKQMYILKPGEHFQPTLATSTITRMPGGWVYSDAQGTCFIPWHNEYQPGFGE